MFKLFMPFLLLLASFSFQQVFAQSYWHQEYLTQVSQGANQVIENADGTFTMAGVFYTAQVNSRDLWLTTIDSEGEILWEKLFGETDVSEGVFGLMFFDSNYWILSQNSLYKADIDGNIVQTIPLEDSASGFSLTADGNIMVASYSTPLPLGFPRATLTKMDTDGNILFQKVLEDDQDDSKVILPAGIVSTQDGGFLLHASEFNTYDDYLYRLDETGNLIWQKSYDWGQYGGTKDIIEKENGHFVVNGFYADSLLQNHLYEIDPNGAIHWENTYTTKGSNSEYNGGLVKTNDNNYVMLTYENNDGVNNGLGIGSYYNLVKIDPNGDLIWSRSFGQSDNYLYNRAKDIIETSSGDLLVVGEFSKTSNTEGAFAQKLNNEGIQLANCTDSEITLRSQADVDAWPGCTVINGTIDIMGDDITDLSPLAGLTNVENLYITSCPNLSNLAGLEDLTEVGNTFVLVQNNTLTDISALTELTAVGEFFYFYQLASLTNLNGLENVTQASTLYLDDNDSLTDISALSNLQEVLNLQIIGNDALTNINGLEGLTNLANGAIIADNQVLANLDGFSNLSTVTGTFVLASNFSLPNLDGLENLTTIDGNLYVSNDSSLVNINGLSNLTSITGEFYLSSNVALEDCCGVFPLLSEGTVGTFIAEENLRCNSQQDIIAFCQPDDCTTTVTLSSQDEVDNWLACDMIGEVLTISGADIVDLSPLSSLTAIGAVLNISNNPMLESLAGLENLSSLGFTLILDNNESLTDISALSGLTTMQGQVVIRDNSSLGNLNGLQNLSFANDFLITNNDDLVDMSALNGVQSIGGFIHIMDNEVLTSIDAFNVLTTIPNQLLITTNPSLTQLNAFQKVTSIGDVLVINQNASLQNLSGLENLTSISQQLVIENNAVLENLDALENLEMLGGSLSIQNNPFLSSCCGIYPLFTDGNILGTANLSNNPNPCSNQGTVLSFCDDGMLTGPDIELNITANATEYGIYRDILFSIEVKNTGTETATNVVVNAPGSFSNAVPMVLTGFRNLTPQIPSFYDTPARLINIPELAVGETLLYEVALYTLGEGEIIEIYGQVVSMDQFDIDSYPGNNFFETPSEDDETLVILNPIDDNTVLTDLELYMSSDKAFVNIGDEVTYTVSLTNNSNVNASGIVVSNFEPRNQTYLDHNLTAGMYNPDDLNWNIGVLAAGNTVTLQYTVSTDDIALNGDNFMHFQVHQVNENDRDSSPGNVFSEMSQLYAHEDDEAIVYIRAAGNQPLTSPDLELDLTVEDTEYTLNDYVTYTLTVNNTGDAVANNVKIDWQVPEGLAHHEAIVSSGDYFSWSGEWFIYQGIPAGGSESIEFTVWTNVEGIPITSYAQVIRMAGSDSDSSVGNGSCCTPIEDDEAAVTIGTNFMNNQVQNRLAPTTVSIQQHQELVIHRVYPNPAMEQVNFSMTSIAAEGIDYVVYNAQGAAIQKGSLSAGQGIKSLNLDLRDYSAGIYYVKFNTNTFHHPVRFIKQ